MHIFLKWLNWNNKPRLRSAYSTELCALNSSSHTMIFELIEFVCRMFSLPHFYVYSFSRALRIYMHHTRIQWKKNCNTTNKLFSVWPDRLFQFRWATMMMSLKLLMNEGFEARSMNFMEFALSKSNNSPFGGLFIHVNRPFWFRSIN